MSVDLTGV